MGSATITVYNGFKQTCIIMEEQNRFLSQRVTALENELKRVNALLQEISSECTAKAKNIKVILSRN